MQNVHTTSCSGRSNTFCNVHYRKSSYNVILYIYICTHIPDLTIRFVLVYDFFKIRTRIK